MNLRQLKIFTEVCQEMNMSRAARKLYISQSSVSQVIQELEQEYQVRLFERMAKKIYLTEEGERLLFHAKQVLYSAKQLTRSMEELSVRERLRIGAATTVGACLLHPLLNHFERAFPGVSVTAEIANSGRLEEEILGAKLDMAILQGIPGSDEIQAAPVFEDSLVFVCPKGHPFEGMEIPMDRLSGEPAVLREEGSGTRRLLERLFRENGLPLNGSWICPGIQETKRAVMEGRGISLLSAYAVKREVEEGRLGSFRVQGQNPVRQFHLIWHRDKYQTGSMEGFRELCRDCEQIQNMLSNI